MQRLPGLSCHKKDRGRFERVLTLRFLIANELDVIDVELGEGGDELWTARAYRCQRP